MSAPQYPPMDASGVSFGTLPHDRARDGVLLMLRSHFSGHPVHPWREPPARGKLSIHDEQSFNRTETGALPFLVVYRPSTRTIKMAIGDMAAMDFVRQVTRHVQLTESVIRIGCAADTPLQSEGLASEVIQLFRYRKYDFMDLVNAINLDVFGMGPRVVQGGTAQPEDVETSVDLQVRFVEEWTHRRDVDAPPLADIVQEEEIEVDC